MKKIIVTILVAAVLVKPARALLPPTILVDVWAMFGQIFVLLTAFLASGFTSIYFALRYKLRKMPKWMFIVIGVGIVVVAGIVSWGIVYFYT